MDEKFLYVVLSATPSRIGSLIRHVTGAELNHASISLDPQLQTMYGFARRYYRTPFYSGFVRETPSRYCINGNSARIEVYKIPVSAQVYQQLQQQLEQMYSNKEQYLYNHFSAWLFPLHCRIPAKDSYVCVEFCVEMLSKAGIDVHPGKYYTIQAIRRLLQPFADYRGPMPPSQTKEDGFFARKPIPHPIWSSLCSIAALIPRIGGK